MLKELHKIWRHTTPELPTCLELASLFISQHRNHQQPTSAGYYTGENKNIAKKSRSKIQTAAVRFRRLQVSVDKESKYNSS